MSIHNVYTELSSSLAAPDGGAVYARGTTVPTDGDAGYASGCIFVDTDATTLDTIIYVNIGTVTSCNFDAAVMAS